MLCVAAPLEMLLPSHGIKRTLMVRLVRIFDKFNPLGRRVACGRACGRRCGFGGGWYVVVGGGGGDMVAGGGAADGDGWKTTEGGPCRGFLDPTTDTP